MQTHSTLATPELPLDAAEALLVEVDFKWLMAGKGQWIDPARLHGDQAYAAQMLGQALDSPSAALRQCAAQLQRTIAPHPAA